MNRLHLNLRNEHSILDNNIQLVQTMFYLYSHKQNYNLFEPMKYSIPIFHSYIFLPLHLLYFRNNFLPYCVSTSTDFSRTSSYNIR